MRARFFAFLFPVIAACSEHAAPGGGASGPATIRVGGSSTVYPITEAVAEAYQAAHRDRRVTVSVSGTGGGFKKFCAGELDITGASRPVKTSEVEACRAAGIDFIELPVAFDGIAVVVNPGNDWVDHLTPAELKTMWEPAAQEKVTRWSQVRAGWPDAPLHLFGPGVDSGTYDYFTEAIVGEEHSSRGDFTSSEDDNVLVTGVAGDVNALGFFGLAYYVENRDKLKAVPIAPADGAPAVSPSAETVANGTYQPLSRPVFIYVARAAADRPEVAELVESYLSDEGAKLVAEVGYVGIPAETRALVQGRFHRKVTGSVFEGGSKVGVKLADLLEAER